RECLERLLDLCSADEHSLHLDGVTYPPEEAGELRRSAPARTFARRRHRADVARGEAQQRIGRVEDRGHDLSGLSGYGWPAGFQIEHLDDAVRVQVHPALLCALVGEQAQVG